MGTDPAQKALLEKANALRARIEGGKITPEERCELLRIIYDCNLIRWVIAAVKGEDKGTGAMQLSLERARLELEVWGDSETKSKKSNVIELRLSTSSDYDG